MGGTKKKSMSQADKTQASQDNSQAGGSKKPEKKTAKEARLAQQQARQQALIMPKMDEKQLLKILSPLKAITIHGASRSLGLNVAIAAQALRNLESKNVIRRVGGYSGHYIYTLVSSTGASQSQGSQAVSSA